LSKNYQNQTTIPQLIANSMRGVFFLKHGVCSVMRSLRLFQFVLIKSRYCGNGKPCSL